MRWRNSPCTGMKNCGRATAKRVLISSCLACPLTWTAARPEWMTSAPSRWIPSITCPTLCSLPGMACELRMTVSPGTELDPPVLPRGHQGEGGHRLALAARRHDAHPLGRVVGDLLDVDEVGVGDGEQPQLARRARRSWPSTARAWRSTRPCATAASAICWMRWMWRGEAGHDDALGARPGRTARAAPSRPPPRCACARAPRRWSSRRAAGGSLRSWRWCRSAPGRCAGRRRG